MKRIVPFIALVALSGCNMRGCNPLVKIVNEKFPPVDPTGQELVAVQAATAQLDQLSSALVYVALSSADLKRNLPKSIQTRANGGSISVKAQDVAVELGNREVVVRSGFTDVTFGPEQIRADGEIEAHCSIAVENGALTLHPSVAKIKVKSLSRKDTKVPDQVVSLLSAALQPFINNVNGAIAAQRLPIDLHVIERFELPKTIHELFDKEKGRGGPIADVRDVQGSTIDVNVGMGRSSVFIDVDGIHVIADAVVLFPQLVVTTIGELKQVAQSGDSTGAVPHTMGLSLSSPQIAVLGECGENRLALTDSIRADLSAVCEALRPRLLASKPAVIPVPTTGDLNAQYSKLKDVFVQKVSLVENPSVIPWKKTAIVISRAGLASGLNQLVAGANASADLLFTPQTGEIAEKDRTVRLDKAPELNCAQAGGGCESTFSFRDPPNRGCPSSCSHKEDVKVFGRKVGEVDVPDLACAAYKPICEAQKVADMAGYVAEKSTKQAEWSVQKAACEAVKSGKIAGCNLNQGWLNDWSDKDVGEIRGHFEARNVELKIAIDNIAVGHDLETIALRTVAAGGGEVAAALTIVPHNEGTIVCVAQWDANLRARFVLPQVERDLTATRAEVQKDQEKNSLLVTYSIPETAVTVRFDPPPIKAFVEQNAAKLALNCPVPAVLAASLAGFTPVNIVAAIKIREEVLKDSQDFKIPASKVSFEIPVRRLDLAGYSIELSPAWEARSVVFHGD